MRRLWIGTVLALAMGGTALGQATRGPAPAPVPATIDTLRVDGAHTWGEPGLNGPTLGIDRAMIAWVMADFYPPASWKAGEEGETTVLACVDETGRVVKTGVLKSSGFARLDEASLAMMAALPMKPSTLNGKAVAFCPYALSVEWKLPDPASSAVGTLPSKPRF